MDPIQGFLLFFSPPRWFLHFYFFSSLKLSSSLSSFFSLILPVLNSTGSYCKIYQIYENLRVQCVVCRVRRQF
jgi:hypothetical protein